MLFPRLRTLLFGRPLWTREADERRVAWWTGVPVLGLDALASAAYGPEAALTVLAPAGTAGPRHATPLLLAIVVLLAIVQASYRQTIAAYPDGGGSYTVARQNLGLYPGLLAGAALFIDYVLNVAVAISAGVGALISAVPALQPHTLGLTLLILAVITLVNLRGVRDTGTAFMVPTYAFVALMGGILLLGVARVLFTAGPATPVTPPPALPPPATAVGIWLLAHAFASGCTAMTGVEAVSNAVPIFREPRVVNARRTLSAIVAVLALLVVSLSIVCPAYHIGATPPGGRGYQSVLSQATGAIVGRGVFYYLTMAATIAVLCLSANTSFSGFPRLGRVLAQDGFLPADFAHLGSRLVYSRGIVLLAVLAGALLVVFGGVTDRLIPLFAVGAFLAFTMSQAGMVAHGWRQRGRRWQGAVLMNATGAVLTFATLVVVILSKFSEGAWITLLVLVLLVALLRGVHAHLTAIDRATVVGQAVDFTALEHPIVVVPLKRLDRVAARALRFAATISADAMAVQVLAANQDERDLSPDWQTHVEEPARAAGVTAPRLVVLRSPYREVIDPLLTHVRRLAQTNPGRSIAVLVPELVERRWYHTFLHSHTATLLKALLLLQGGPQVVVINTPWYLRDQ